MIKLSLGTIVAWCAVDEREGGFVANGIHILLSNCTYHDTRLRNTRHTIVQLYQPRCEDLYNERKREHPPIMYCESRSGVA